MGKNEDTSRFYLTNSNMLVEIVKSKEQNRMTEDFGKMIILLTDKISSRPNFSGYTFIDEMRFSAILTIVKSWQSFDETKYSNPFAYFSTYIFNSFIQHIKSEKKLMTIKNKMLVDAGLNPSFSYSEENSSKKADDDLLNSKLLFDPKDVFEAPSDDNGVKSATFENNYDINWNDNNSIHVADNLYRTFELGDCKVHYMNNGDFVKILAIKTPLKLRGKGYASLALANFLYICDELKIDTTLSYVPLDDKTDDKMLLAWFSKLGYVLDNKSNFTMIRKSL